MKEWEFKRQKHKQLAVEIGREYYAGDYHDFGVDFYLGSFVQRVFDGQMDKLKCLDPENYFGQCPFLEVGSIEEIQKTALKFYERENCQYLLK